MAVPDERKANEVLTPGELQQLEVDVHIWYKTLSANRGLYVPDSNGLCASDGDTDSVSDSDGKSDGDSPKQHDLVGNCRGPQLHGAQLAPPAANAPLHVHNPMRPASVLQPPDGMVFDFTQSKFDLPTPVPPSD